MKDKNISYDVIRDNRLMTENKIIILFVASVFKQLFLEKKWIKHFITNSG